MSYIVIKKIYYQPKDLLSAYDIEQNEAHKTEIDRNFGILCANMLRLEITRDKPQKILDFFKLLDNANVKKAFGYELPNILDALKRSAEQKKARTMESERDLIQTFQNVIDQAEKIKTSL